MGLNKFEIRLLTELLRPDAPILLVNYGDLCGWQWLGDGNNFVKESGILLENALHKGIVKICPYKAGRAGKGRIMATGKGSDVLSQYMINNHVHP